MSACRPLLALLCSADDAGTTGVVHGLDWFKSGEGLNAQMLFSREEETLKGRLAGFP